MHKLHRQHQQPHRNSLFPTFFPLRPSSRQSRSPFAACPSYLRALPCLICELILFAPFPAASTRHFSSPRMPEQHHIAFLYNVLFPFQPNLSLFLRRRNTSRRDQIVPSHHFRPNKSLLDVAMNHTRGLHRRVSLANRPCSRSEEHTSELQSLTNLVCRLLLEKKKP